MARFIRIDNKSDRTVSFINDGSPETSKALPWGVHTVSAPLTSGVSIQTKLGTMRIHAHDGNATGYWEFDHPVRSQVLENDITEKMELVIHENGGVEVNNTKE